jgi:hypothetical protein
LSCVFGKLTYFTAVFENSFKRGDSSLIANKTWQEIFESVLIWRKEEDPDNVDANVWAGFLLYAFVLVPCVHSW